MAFENAGAAAISDPDTQKRFDRMFFYFGIGCLFVIHIVFVGIAIMKVRSSSSTRLLIFFDV